MVIQNRLSTTNTANIQSEPSRSDAAVSVQRDRSIVTDRRKPRSSRRPPAQNRPDSGPARRAGGGRPAVDGDLLFGRHAVEAALRNPARPVTRIWCAGDASAEIEAFAATLEPSRRKALPDPTPVDRPTLDEMLPAGAVHQNLAAAVGPLPAPSLADLCARWAGEPDVLVVVLDQVTDPHNVGAVLRSAAAFGARAVVVQDRHAPPATGTLAKSASGALELVPLVRETNLARALVRLQEAGFWCIGLAEQGGDQLAEVRLDGRCALVLGAEGTGLRRLVRETCDVLARLPTLPPMPSLNVSAAAAVALYEAFRSRSGASDGASGN